MQCLARLHAQDVSKLSLVDSKGEPYLYKKEPCVFRRLWKALESVPKELINIPEKNEK